MQPFKHVMLYMFGGCFLVYSMEALVTFDATAFEAYLKDLLAGLNINLSPERLRQCAAYAGELMLWNKITNLTTITDTLEIAEKHFADSLSALPYVLNGSDTTVLDIGSGGGFPAIPFVIADDRLKVTAVDAVRKKISFQEHVKAQLGLVNLTPVHARIQELDKACGFKPAYDCVISRAFAGLDTFFALALPWVKPGGKLITYKSQTLDDELAALQAKYSGLEINCHAYNLPNAKARFVVVLENLGKH